MQIFIYGDDARLRACKRLFDIAEEEGRLSQVFGDVHLLPIPSRSIQPEELKSQLLQCAQQNEGNARLENPSLVSEAQRHSDRVCDAGNNAFISASSPKVSNVRDVTCGTEKSPLESASKRREEGRNQVSENTKKRNLLVGYEVPRFLYEMEGLEVFDLAQDEPFLWRNARLCALGTLGIILTEHSRVPSDLHIGVIGYGRIGREVCDLLTFLETSLVVFTSKREVVDALKKKNVSAVLVDWKENSHTNVNQTLQNDGIFSSVDILINTSPSPLGEAFFEGFSGVVYDLASGTPIPKSVPHTRLSSLPMRMYAQSAGFAVYRAIIDKYSEILQ